MRAFDGGDLSPGGGEARRVPGAAWGGREAGRQGELGGKGQGGGAKGRGGGRVPGPRERRAALFFASRRHLLSAPPFAAVILSFIINFGLLAFISETPMLVQGFLLAFE